jgi:hypothetical protein
MGSTTIKLTDDLEDLGACRSVVLSPALNLQGAGVGIKKRSKPEGAAVRIKKCDNVFANRPKAKTRWLENLTTVQPLKFTFALPHSRYLI